MLTKIILYNYHLLFSNNYSDTEKLIFDHLINDLNINISDFSLDFLVKAKNDFNFNHQFEFLYYLHKSANSLFFIDEHIMSILKKHTIKTGFCNSDLNELSGFLIESAKLNKSFEELLKNINP